MLKIDCHTHIVNEEIRAAYFARTDGCAIVMEFLDRFRVPGMEQDVYAAVQGDKRLFLCPCIDISREIPPQLARIETLLDSYQIVGLKVYLTYQAGRADDARMMPIYDFARRHRLTVTYHTGSCSLVLESDNALEDSNAIYVQNVAKLYPDVNFVVAHMDDPRYDACIRIIHEQPNMYTDFSGAYEPGTPEGGSMDWAIETFARAIHQFPDTYRKILYGTDFCPPINLEAIEDYDVTIGRIFEPEQFEDIYCRNCLRAFPRLADYLKLKENEPNADPKERGAL